LPTKSIPLLIKAEKGRAMGRGKEGFSVEAGGVEKQPNSCNLCHYHKKDPADKLQLVMDKMKEEYYK